MTFASQLLIGFDFGMKYIGVATGQTLTGTATPLTTIRAQDGIPDWSEIEKLIQDWQATALIIGIPLNMDGSEQVMTFRAKKFANRLHEKFKLPIHLVDERLTSWEAKERLNGKNTSQTDLDKLNSEAAAIIVEQWLRDNT